MTCSVQGSYLCNSPTNGPFATPYIPKYLQADILKLYKLPPMLIEKSWSRACDFDDSPLTLVPKRRLRWFISICPERIGVE